MSKASDKDLGDLHGAIAVGLTTIVKEGVVIGLDDEGAPIKAAASAAYYMAAITLLKNNNITADASKNASLAGLTDTLAEKRRARKTGMTSMADALKDAGHDLERELGGPLQ
jgi:hypothetical protein